MSVTDFSAVDPRTLNGKGRVGLLDSTGTYDVDRYAWAYEFWKRQQQTHWMGEEVPLGADLKDWASERVTINERALLTQIFRFFTQSDIEDMFHHNAFRLLTPSLEAPAAAMEPERTRAAGGHR